MKENSECESMMCSSEVDTALRELVAVAVSVLEELDMKANPEPIGWSSCCTPHSDVRRKANASVSFGESSNSDVDAKNEKALPPISKFK